MDKPRKVIVNCTTGERTIVELTDEEIAEREAMAAQAQLDRVAEEEAEQARLEAKASAQAKLAALGLTEAEIQALGI
jgi:hypothetical protein